MTSSGSFLTCHRVRNQKEWCEKLKLQFNGQDGTLKANIYIYKHCNNNECSIKNMKKTLNIKDQVIRFEHIAFFSSMEALSWLL